VRDRTKARAWALQVLYAWESRDGVSLDDVLEEFLDRRLIAPTRRPYLRRLVETLAVEMAAVDAALQQAVTNWRLGRLSVVDRNILRVGAVELMCFSDIPPRVSIQEALRLAERYGTDQSPRFVNGVLDALMQRLEKE
jgi:N utilization substance protein B